MQKRNIQPEGGFMVIKKKEAESKPEEKSVIKFCPICGSTMHKEKYLGNDWWFCDDAEGCGFFEPVK
jgi:ssDNA-binding Zn-finger/Zn-ribbon topoisomerase 1